MKADTGSECHLLRTQQSKLIRRRACFIKRWERMSAIAARVVQAVRPSFNFSRVCTSREKFLDGWTSGTGSNDGLVALEKSQAACAAMLRVSPESSRPWDAGRRATPPQVMVRAKAITTDGRGARRDLTSPLVFHRLPQNPCKLLFINLLLVCCTPRFPHCTPHSERDFPAPRTPAVDRSGLDLCRPPPHADLTLA